jgi:hypothetical protein
MVPARSMGGGAGASDILLGGASLGIASGRTCMRSTMTVWLLATGTSHAETRPKKKPRAHTPSTSPLSPATRIQRASSGRHANSPRYATENSRPVRWFFGRTLQNLLGSSSYVTALKSPFRGTPQLSEK